jgi:small subunit ribosomal protein S7
MPRKAPARVVRSKPTRSPSVLVTQLINKVLLEGQEALHAERSCTTPSIVEKTGAEPLDHAQAAIDNIKPQLEVRAAASVAPPTRCPVEVRPRRANTLAIRWLVGFARKRRERTMAERLANEILDASNGLGVGRQAPRGHPQDGRVQQGLRALPLVVIP